MSKARELSKLPNYVLSTIAELKLAVGKEQGDKAFVGGYYADGDGGGGDFYWDATSVETDNGGTILQVTGTTTGRWKRIYSGSVNVKWFGAKDSTIVGNENFNSTVAIQSAISSYFEVFIPRGEYLVGGMELSNPTNIRGEKGSVLKLLPENGYIFNVNTNNANFNTVTFDGSLSDSSRYGDYFASGVIIVSNEKVSFYGCTFNLFNKQDGAFVTDCANVSDYSGVAIGGIIIDGTGGTAQQITINECSFANCTSGITKHSCHNSNISYSYFTGCKFGIYSMDSESNIITGNLFRDITTSGIIGYNMWNTNVDSNVFRRVSSTSIRMDIDVHALPLASGDTGAVKINFNQIEGSESAVGIYANNPFRYFITQNTFATPYGVAGTPNYAIQIISNGTISNRCFVLNNSIYAFHLSAINLQQVIDIEVTGNAIGGSPTDSEGDGILMNGAIQSKRVSIKDNHIFNLDKNGIKIDNLSHGIVADNYIYDIGKLATNTYQGIRLGDTVVNRTIVRNNIIRSDDASFKMQNGILLTATANTNYINGNMLVGYATSAISNSGNPNYLDGNIDGALAPKLQDVLSGAGSPISVVTPNQIGVEYLDTTNNKWYKSNGTTSTNWLILN